MLTDAESLCSIRTFHGTRANCRHIYDRHCIGYPPLYRNQELDLGVVTFFFVLITSVYEQRYYTGGAFTRKIKWILVVSSIMVAANYGLVFLLWGGLKENFRSTAKNELWITIFYWYCVVMMAFWVCAAIKTSTRSLSSENGYTVPYCSILTSSILFLIVSLLP